MNISHSLPKLAALLALAGALGAGWHFAHAALDAKPAPTAPLPPAGPLKFAPGAPQLAALKVVTVVAAPLPLADPMNGRIAYDENRTARISSPVAGRVLSARLETGDAVARGAVLAVLDAPDLATAQADWRKARADEVRKRLAFERAQALFDGEVLARKDWESAQADLQQAQAETARAAQRLKNLQTAGSGDVGMDGNFSLRSPIAGILAEKQINPGLEVRPDLPAPLFVVTDLRHLWVIVDVPERSSGALKAGQRVTLDVDAYPGERFDARIERVGLTLDPGTRRVQVRCAVDNPDGKLKPEMFARVAFLAGDGSRQAIALPNTSLFAEGLYTYAFVETVPGTFEKRRVNLALRGFEVSFVDAGIASGERVVTEGAFLLNAEVAANAR